MIPLQKISGRLGNQMFQLAYLIAQEADRVIPDIYVQDPYYFEEHTHKIKRLFGTNIPPKLDQVAIHVRRGDYVNNPFYVDLSLTDYYEKAMELFPTSTFLVFSDDIEWCKDRFQGKQFEFFHSDELTDLNTMAACSGHIIANSSFSWWGAYLSPNCGKVVAPSVDNWYTDGIERTKCPESWIRI